MYNFGEWIRKVKISRWGFWTYANRIRRNSVKTAKVNFDAKWLLQHPICQRSCRKQHFAIHSPHEELFTKTVYRVQYLVKQRCFGKKTPVHEFQSSISVLTDERVFPAKSLFYQVLYGITTFCRLLLQQQSNAKCYTATNYFYFCMSWWQFHSK